MEYKQSALPLPSPRHLEWYRRGKTAFIHFNMNTFTDREWGDGSETPAQFAPTELDCRQWARVLKEGGFTAAILTAKHHDGFCLWPSAYTEHSVKNSPSGRDVVAEFTAACREFGIKPGLYISPWDRNHSAWGTDAYNDIFDGQLTELLTGYGPVWECWWDGAGSTQAHYDWARWAATVRRLQPECVLFGSLGAAEYVDVRWVGNEQGRAGEDCWATIDPEMLRQEICAELNTGSPEGSRFIPAETNTSIRPGWYYHADQDSWVKDPEELVDYWFRSAGRNTAILLNLPPDRRGLIHEKDALAVKQWEQRLRSIFRENLAWESIVLGEPGAENLTDDREEKCYEAESLCPTVEFRFPREREFDCFRLEEAIEWGHRIRSFALEAETAEGWKTLAKGACVGFCRAERFAPVKATAVRLRVLQAAAPPVLRFFGLYRGAAPQSSRKEAGFRECPVSLTRKGRELEIDLGGQYPFDTVWLDTPPETPWQVHCFNGICYELTADARGESCSFPLKTGSFRLKLTAPEPFPENVRVRVYRSPETAVE